MNIYLETARKLQRLGLNETKMSQEQFVRYASTLKKYRTDIIAGANEILRHFWFGGLYVKKKRTGSRRIMQGSPEGYR